MKSSLKKQSSVSTQNISQKYDPNIQLQQNQLQQQKGNGKFDLGSFQPFKATKQSQKLRIAQIQTDNVPNKQGRTIENTQLKQNNTQQETKQQSQKQSEIPKQLQTNVQPVLQNKMINKQQQNGENSGVEIALIRVNLPQDKEEQKIQKSNVENTKEDQNQINKIASIQQLQNVGNKQNNEQTHSISLKQLQEGTHPKQEILKTRDIPNEQQSMKSQSNEQNKQELKQKQSIVTNNQQQNTNQRGDSLPFEYKVSNRRRLSQKSQLDISLNKSIAEMNEGFQERDLDKEKLDIRRMFNKNSNQSDEEEIQRSKDIQEKVFNPSLSNIKRDKKDELFKLTRHSKYLGQINIKTIINFEMINQIDPEIRLFHLFFDLIDKTESTMKQEYSEYPEFLYYLSILNDIIKTCFSKIAVHRRKSIIIEQQEKVQECLFNKWESSKQRVMQSMMQKYLKKYDKFKKIDERFEKSKEYIYLQRSISGFMSQPSALVIPQKEILQKIEEQQKKNIIEIEQSKNVAIMKPVVDGLELIKKGQEHIIDQQNKMAKSYEKLTKLVFPDWKEIDSFDEFSWLQSQKQIVEIA